MQEHSRTRRNDAIAETSQAPQRCSGDAAATHEHRHTTTEQRRTVPDPLLYSGRGHGGRNALVSGHR